MGARYLKAEEAAIRAHYATASRPDILNLIPDRTWLQIGAHARRMGIHRTTQVKGDSIREGRKVLPDSWTGNENDKFDLAYPHSTRETLLILFQPHTWLAIQSHAARRGLHRSIEAKGKQISIGRREARERRERHSLLDP